MPCTTILVGRKASYDGSTIIARNDDSPSGIYMPKNFITVKAEDQPRKYKSVLSHVEIDLPDNPLDYTCLPNAVEGEGIWGAAGVNSANVGMTATETITSNSRVLGADSLVKYQKGQGKPGSADYQAEVIGGIGEEDFISIVLPYIRSAKEGVIRVGKLLEEYGTYEMNGMAFSDTKDIWWLETIGGHHWIARRVPENAYVTMPNQFGLDHFDFEDAFGPQQNFMCSADLLEFIKKNHLNLNFPDEDFNPRLAFGSADDSDHTYNTCRAWVLQRHFNPNSFDWDSSTPDFGPESNDIPWCMVPERLLTVEDVKYGLSNHYQGTKYDPYGHADNAKWKSIYRPIGVNRTDDLAIIQIRPYAAEAGQAVEWISLGSNVFNASVPFYTNVEKTPTYLSNASDRVTSENFYWVNRLVAALADPHFNKCAIHIERYQLAVQTKGHEILQKYDPQLVGLDHVAARPICEKANQEMADFLKAETDKLLDKVLYEASNLMRNGFARSDA